MAPTHERKNWSKLTRLYAEFLSRQGKARNTVLAYGSHAQRFNDWLAERGNSIARACPDDLANYLNALSEDGASPGERSNRRAALIQFYVYAIRALTSEREDGTPTGGSGRGLAETHQIAQD